MRLPPQREGQPLVLRRQAVTYLRTVTWRQMDSAKVLHDVAAHKPRDYGTILHNHHFIETGSSMPDARKAGGADWLFRSGVSGVLPSEPMGSKTLVG